MKRGRFVNLPLLISHALPSNCLLDTFDDVSLRAPLAITPSYWMVDSGSRWASSPYASLKGDRKHIDKCIRQRLARSLGQTCIVDMYLPKGFPLYLNIVWIGYRVMIIILPDSSTDISTQLTTAAYLVVIKRRRKRCPKTFLPWFLVKW